VNSSGLTVTFAIEVGEGGLAATSDVGADALRVSDAARIQRAQRELSALVPASRGAGVDPALATALEALARGQEQLRHDVQASREAAVRDLGEASRRIHVELSAAQRALAEAAARRKAAEELAANRRRMDAAA
jgi:hypothetical protein